MKCSGTPLLLSALAVLLLGGCMQETKAPVIAYIGTAVGDMNSDITTLQFTDRFSTEDTSLLTVVGFENIAEGTTVRAMWFSPDDRTAPIGLQTITAEGNGTIARFLLRPNVAWDSAPYKVIVYAEHDHDDNPDTMPLRGSGSMQFFIGLSEDEINEYKREFAEWERRDNEKRAARAAKNAIEQEALQYARENLGAPEAITIQRLDVDGDGTKELLVIDTKNQPEAMPDVGRYTVNGFVITSPLYGILLSSKDERIATSPLFLQVLQTGTVMVSWQEGRKRCEREYRWDAEGGKYVVGVERCT